MHEFLLYSQVPAARHVQVLQILAGITAAQPIKFSEQHVVYQQLKATQTASTKKTQATPIARGAQLNYCKLVAQAPTVIAEMEFVDKVGADAVIDTFNNKKV